MRLAFAGTPEFAAVALRALCDAGHKVGLVLCQPDRPAGRGMKLHAGPVKLEALKRGLTLAQPRSLRLDGRFADDAKDARERLSAAGVQLMVVAAYGLILPRWVLELPRHGCLNIHASLLPRWRGAAPIQRAIEAGDEATGVCIMQMDEGLDTGPVLARAREPILPEDDSQSLHERLAARGAALLLNVIEAMAAGRPPLPEAQPETGACYARKIARDEVWIDWAQPAEAIARKIRALAPTPGAATCLPPMLGAAPGTHGETLKIFSASVVESDPRESLPPGSIVAADSRAGLLVACGHGSRLMLGSVQRPSGKRVDARQLLQGLQLPIGAVLGGPVPQAGSQA